MTKIPLSRRIILMEVATLGLPFCGFKILTGLSLLGDARGGLLLIPGYFLLTLGSLDVLVNLVNAGTLLVTGHRLTEPCGLAMLSSTLGRGSKHPQWAWQDFGNASDVMLSFSMVAFMIWGGRLNLLPAFRMNIWSACVIVNVLGAGVGRLSGSFNNFLAT